MILLVAGLIVFFAVHSISIVNPGWRDRVAAGIGEWTWKAAYSAVALAGLLMIIWGYGQARLDPVWLYTPPIWLRHLSLLLLIFAFPLLLATYLPGRIQAVTKHPMLVATKLWALAHLLANGTLADVLLFGSFLAWAVVDRISLKRRTPGWVPSAPPSRFNDAIAVGGGLVLYAVFLMGLHAWLFGVSPIG